MPSRCLSLLSLQRTQAHLHTRSRVSPLRGTRGTYPVSVFVILAACPDEGQDPEEEEADERAVDRGVAGVELEEHGAEVDGVGGDEEGAGEGGAGCVVTDAHRLLRAGDFRHLKESERNAQNSSIPCPVW